MSDASIAAVISSVISLLTALIWPLVFLFLILRFRKPLARLIEPIAHGVQERIAAGGGGEASVSFAGLSFSGRIDSASKLVATASEQPGAAGGPVTTDQARRVLTEAIPNDEAAAKIAGSSVLWVDDVPSNNRYVVDALHQLGAVVVQVTSTDQAKELLKTNEFDAIISDMGRAERDGYNTRAGYDLLADVRADHMDTPFFIYAGSSLPEHVIEARKRGAQGSTNRAAELISMVTSALVAR
ncbi:response regulator [Microbacterium rhizosphaerae]|uniref:Response regulator n=1 Tax=Microbacterium rhizosphaerae TaxID=1678237 RepID=A0ABZ0SM09_9MICO|nr:response regulator [Microbacterium rhizosphaerae]WPR88727.1 response regulator [Microbacterium rhizosphaerae]